jgi:eukaryotic-like serine/threonine-protein kinase
VIGRQISHFYIIRNLGSGGMGVVYEAQDTRLPQSVAIKFLKPSLSTNPDAIRRFRREARLASLLNHPNICTVLDVGEEDGQLFIAMELLRGQSLKARLQAGMMSLEEIVDVATQVADALATAHDQGIVHRDITPGNIFLTGDGIAKLLDFGLARHFAAFDDADGQTTDELTMPGGAMGTIQYMAPERLVGNGPLDYRCDLFSFGVVLYQMATGSRPFTARSKQDYIRLIRDQPHVPMRQLAAHHPEQLESIIDRLLAKRPEDRYQTAWVLRTDLDLLSPRSTASARPAVRGSRASVAVLPFRIVGPVEPHSVHFRDGLVEDISSRLSTVRDVRVAPRTSTGPLAGESVRTIGKRLDVEMVLEGSVQAAGGRIRVTANLIDAANERSVLPTITVERPLEDTLTVQDDIARAIADGLTGSLGRVVAQRDTQDPDAYQAFKRGLQHWKTSLAGGWRPAIEHFQDAVQRDPEFALAHVALANAYNFLGFYCLMKPNLAFEVAGQSAARALEIDDTLSSAHVELALVKFGGDWDWEGAESEFRRAVALDPANALAHVYYSWLLVLLGRDAVARAEAEAGHSLAPSSRLVVGGCAQTLYLAGRYDEAIELCNECLRVTPDYVFAMHIRGLCYLVKSMYPEALADLEQAATMAGRAPFYLGILGLGYGQYGMRQEALALVPELNRLARDMYVPPQAYVFIYAGLGKREEALEYQDRAYQDGASPFNYLTPGVRQLYALDPHHKRRLDQMRLTV